MRPRLVEFLVIDSIHWKKTDQPSKENRGKVQKIYNPKESKDEKDAATLKDILRKF